MITAGMIAEFNPFHAGHLELIQRVRKDIGDGCLVVVVSTYFSSRGLPSLMDPQTKTRLALEAGADLVIALPAVYAMQSADYFALYAIEALKCAGVNLLCFGSESADGTLLEQSADAIRTLEPDPATSLARNAQNQGIAPGPNDILAIQYIRWAREFGISFKPYLRNQSLKSATAIRKDYFEGLKQEGDKDFHPAQSWKSYYPYLRLMLMETDPAILRTYFLVDEGIEYRLIRAALDHADYDGFLNACISKTYSRARIQRTCMMILMQIDKKEMKAHRFFFSLILLGMNETGQRLLASLPEYAPVYSRFRDLDEWTKTILQKEMRMYGLIDGNMPIWKPVRLAGHHCCSDKTESDTPEDSEQ